MRAVYGPSSRSDDRPGVYAGRGGQDAIPKIFAMNIQARLRAFSPLGLSLRTGGANHHAA
jgi:hypothetical protein